MRTRATPRPGLQALRSAGLDASLTPAQLDHLASHADLIEIPAGATLARSGRYPREMVVVLAGAVDIDGGHGLGTSGRGTRIGAVELAGGRPHAATVTARTPCTVLVVFGPAYQAALCWSRPERRPRRFAPVRRARGLALG